MNVEARLLDNYVRTHAGELADLLDDAETDELAALLGQLSPPRAAQLLEQLPSRDAVAALGAMSVPARSQVLSSMDVTRSAALLRALDEPARMAWLESLDAALAVELRELATHAPDTAGNLMHGQLVTFPPTALARQVLSRLQGLSPREAEAIAVVDAGGVLLGLLPLSQVVLAASDTPLAQLIGEPPPRVQAAAPKEDVLQVFSAGHLDLLPVVDGNDRLLGMIHADAIVATAREQASADLATLVGASRDERALSPVLFTVRKRLPWLNINLLTAFLAAAVVGIFESLIAQVTALAVLLPVVAGQSGNTGAQSLAVVIRGLALREIRTRHWLPVLTKECLAGLINGVAIAVVTVIGVYLWSQSPGLCLVIFLAMIMSMIIAGAAGAAIPLLLTALRQDPAQSGSIILTTVTDVLGFFSFLGLATLFAGLL